ncbi:LuxR family transcriptional regulator [Pandoraea iniqua]|uniref:LuxR family transcriptional regulator n=1 Tax=Pandoraea iniqua TaxID=2508288 RepID=A0A5E4SVB3_9BURK|nr:response regulator transcription factor [Pandoraea iniqua]VVD79710.1 LuxR family transcriptional regulator [Pandoraea iniqua]
MPPIPSRPTRVLIADPHPIFVYGLTNALANQNEFAIVGVVTEIRQIFSNIKRADVDILLCAYEFHEDPLPDGLAFLERLRRVHPSLKIVVSANFLPDSPLVKFAMSAGISGLLCKSELNSETLISSLRRVAGSQRVCTEKSTRSENVAPERDTAMRALSLSKTELEVLRHHIRDNNDKEIAFRRRRATKTISNQRSGAFKKLCVSEDNPKQLVDVLASLRSWLIG